MAAGVRQLSPIKQSDNLKADVIPAVSLPPLPLSPLSLSHPRVLTRARARTHSQTHMYSHTHAHRPTWSRLAPLLLQTLRTRMRETWWCLQSLAAAFLDKAPFKTTTSHSSSSTKSHVICTVSYVVSVLCTANSRGLSCVLKWRLINRCHWNNS